MTTVELIGGPFDGVKVDVSPGASVEIFGGRADWFAKARYAPCERGYEVTSVEWLWAAS